MSKSLLLSADKLQERFLVKNRNSKCFCLVQFTSRRFTREHVIRFFADTSRGFSAEPFNQVFRLLPAVGRKGACNDYGFSCDRAFRGLRNVVLRCNAVLQKRIDLRGNGRISEEGEDAFGNDFPDIIDGKKIVVK